MSARKRKSSTAQQSLQWEETVVVRSDIVVVVALRTSDAFICTLGAMHCAFLTQYVCSTSPPRACALECPHNSVCIVMLELRIPLRRRHPGTEVCQKALAALSLAFVSNHPTTYLGVVTFCSCASSRPEGVQGILLCDNFLHVCT